ncbi:uncharacterized protein LOC120113108 [Phoenix dactylifera]|uniref:Uncharacterized protein LOC120113108 n=1 Tax=Phoenix dactylifera TaxID=42345 RepID=A0A8B9AW78_PHODC|nr:uncharacterized protein LOC120113108 [Phoenix dactylifera]
MGSWVRTLTSPFRKACTLLNPPRDKKSQTGRCPWIWTLASTEPVFFFVAGKDHDGMKLHGEVKACSYEDVQVMWSILDKSKPGEQNRR